METSTQQLVKLGIELEAVKNKCLLKKRQWIQ